MLLLLLLLPVLLLLLLLLVTVAAVVAAVVARLPLPRVAPLAGGAGVHDEGEVTLLSPLTGDEAQPCTVVANRSSCE